MKAVIAFSLGFLAGLLVAEAYRWQVELRDGIPWTGVIRISAGTGET